MKINGLRFSCTVIFVILFFVKTKEAVPIFPKNSTGDLWVIHPEQRFGETPPENGTLPGSVDDLLGDKISGDNSTNSPDIEPAISSETLENPSVRRCGFEDTDTNSNSKGRSKRFILYFQKWPSKQLTYNVKKYSTSLEKSEVDSLIARSFAYWTNYTDLEFIHKESGPTNISIHFTSNLTGDNHFDGPNGLLGFALLPTVGKLYFDDEENWSTLSYEKEHISLLRVAVHEIGHVLGISHTNVTSAVMYPAYQDDSEFKLDEDDILAIQALYGEKSSDVGKTVSDSTTATTVPRPIENAPDVCENLKIDTIFTMEDVHIYIFAGNYYWHGPTGAIINHSPYIISENWENLPGYIDAAFMASNGTMYFFKGSKFWTYTERTMDKDCPKEISDIFPGIPDHLDAAMETNTMIFVFYKGSEYWEFDSYNGVVIDRSYPQLLSNWEELPNNIDAAVKFDEKLHFFKGDSFYSFPENEFSLASGYPEYPRSMSFWWFNCKSANRRTLGGKNGTGSRRSNFKARYATPIAPTNVERPTFLDAEICTDSKIDTIFQSAGSTYIFKGDHYWKLDAHSEVQNDYPKLIKDTWKELPSDIDAAYTKPDGSTYFYKGSKLWRYVDGIMDKRFPIEKGRLFYGIPEFIDTATVTSNGTIYIFKENQYWTIRPDHKSQNIILKRSMSDWEDLPNDVDAALTHDGHVYIFKGENYFKYTETSFKLVNANAESPRSMPVRWSRCKSTDRTTSDETSTDGTTTHSTIVPSTTPEKDLTETSTNVPSIDVQTNIPTTTPKMVPVSIPTNVPSIDSTDVQTNIPTTTPKMVPVSIPTNVPSIDPTDVQTNIPTTTPKMVPVSIPTISSTSSFFDLQFCGIHKIDAMFHSVGSFYVFQGDHYWKLDAHHEVQNGYPKLIRDTWKELPINIDAAYTKQDGSTYFFKGSEIWKYNGEMLDRRFPVLSRRLFYQFPEYIDAATETSNGTIYVFKGNQYWTIGPNHKSQNLLLKRFISDWEGLPNDVDAALTHDGHVYIFKGENFYKFEESSLKLVVVNAELPGSIADWWSRCKLTNRTTPDGRSTDGTTTYSTIVTSTTPKNDLTETSANVPSIDVQSNIPTTTPKMVPVSIPTNVPSIDSTGVQTNVPTTTPKMVPDSIPTNVPTEGPEICTDHKIDTIFRPPGLGKSIFAFKGNYYWNLTSDEPTIPKDRIENDLWRGLPGDIDAAFAYEKKFTYFIKGSHVWKYVNFDVEHGYPREINNEFPGMPDNIDAAMSTRDGKIYFYKGDKYWMYYSIFSPAVDSSYPKMISKYEGISSDIDAALTLCGYTYFFKDNKVSALKEAFFKKKYGQPEYSVSMTDGWFGCGSTTPRTLPKC